MKYLFNYKKFAKILYYFYICSFIFTSCMNTKTNIVPRKTNLYNQAVKNLGDKIIKELKKLCSENNGEIQFNKGLFIYNKDIQNCEESLLSKNFIEDLGDYLVNKGIQLKRKELITWSRATKQGLNKIECDEIRELIASEYFIEFSLKESPDSKDKMVAIARGRENQSNIIRFAVKQYFTPENNVSKWRSKKHFLPKNKGDKDNPYIDYQEASNYTIGKLSCKLKSLFSEQNPIPLIIAKTKSTPSEIIDIITKSASDYGFSPIATGKWLDVLLKEGDRFEQNIYFKKYRERFPFVDLLLIVDLKKGSYKGLSHLDVCFYTLNSVNIKIKNKLLIHPAGLMLPFGADTGFVFTQSYKNYLNKYKQLFSPTNDLDISFTVLQEKTEIVTKDLGDRQFIHFRIEQIFPDEKIEILYPTDMTTGIIHKNEMLKTISSVKRNPNINGQVFIVVGSNENFSKDEKLNAVFHSRFNKRLTIEEYRKLFKFIDKWEVFSEN